MLGLKRGEARLFPHEKQWETEAAKIIEKLRSMLGSAVHGIEHIGSTSIETIAAKPIIDIAAETDDFEFVEALKTELENNGFYLRDCCHENQILLACGSYYAGTGDKQTCFVHIVKTGSKEWNDYINFRNYLRKNPKLAKEYEALKLKLAAKSNDRNLYTEGKAQLVAHILRKALADSFLGKTVDIVVDRPLGYIHNCGKYSIAYPVNYGYIPGVISGDKEELDVYLLGVCEPVSEYAARVIAIIHRKNDEEDKLVAAPAEKTFSKEEIENAVAFQERFFETEIEMFA